MATLREIIYSIREIVNAYSDDNTLSNEHLAFLINSKRSTYLEILAANVRNQMPREAYQTITLSLVPSEDCEDGFVLLKSKSPLPAVINNPQDTEGMHTVKLDSVMAKWINIVGAERLPFLAAGRFNVNQIYVSRDTDDSLLLLCASNNHVFIDQVKVEIIAENPEQADLLVVTTGKTSSMDFYDKKYPIPEGLIKAIVDETSNELLTKLRLDSDSVNNGTDDTLSQKIPYYGPRRQQAQQQAGQQEA